MTKSKTQRIIDILLAVAAVALIVLGIIHMPQREAQGGRDILDALRIRTLLNATGEGVVESYVAIAKQEASDKAREEGLGMSALREAVAKAEEEARAQHTGTSVDYDTVNTDALVPALEAYTSALSAYYRAADAAEQAYIQEHLPEAEAAAEAEREAKLAAGQEVSEDEEVTVDMSPAPMSVSTPHSISRPFSPLDTISAPGNVLTPLRLQNITFCNSKVKYYKAPKYASS